MSVEWRLAEVCRFVKTNYSKARRRFREYWKGEDLSDNYSYSGSVIAMRRTAVAMHLIGALFFVMALYLGYLAFIDTKPPIEVSNQPMPVLVSDVEPGDLMVVVIDICRADSTPVDITLTWHRLDDNGYFVGEAYKNLVGTQGCHTSRPSYVVPSILPDGRYTLQMDVTYSNNLLHTNTIELETEVFFVKTLDK